MILVKCDMCNCDVDYSINGINLNFNKYGVVDFRNITGENYATEFQLCDRCAKKVVEFIEESNNDKDRKFEV